VEPALNCFLNQASVCVNFTRWSWYLDSHIYPTRKNSWEHCIRITPTNDCRRKVKLSRYRHAGDKGERRHSSYSFLTSAVDGVSAQRHAQAAIYPLEITPGTHSIGGWVGLRTGLNIKGQRKKSFLSSGDQTPVSRSSSLLEVLKK
jgi:hypothetical protein